MKTIDRKIFNMIIDLVSLKLLRQTVEHLVKKKFKTATNKVF